ncbi:uncharacterized protein LOC128672960 [Plodia interpunctella]|uniref:uncharacterized protein LOC128672960 n=1 Tax=Plodia interpunctella TaxID=58824 RepID=UPI0023674ACB|nr:uncharacterized protein LOC128672960 [Plodia interpunctella]XP_053606476.1 uncharacterized protein LOC128672960 [Plodia interpunctella]
MIVVVFSTLFIVLKLCHTISIEDDFPRIQQLFDIPEIEDKNRSTFQPPDIGAQEVTINIEKIDVNRLRRKLEYLPRSDAAREYRAHYNMTKTLINTATNDTPPINVTTFKETSVNDTRRQRIPWYSRWYNWHGTEFNARVKIMDMALQTIYMARHKIKVLEKSKYFNRKDTGYRIAFIYRTIRRLYRRLVDIFMTGKRGLQKPYNLIWSTHDHLAYMHHRAIKFHVDFLYYYWVMVEIDKKYRDEYRIRQSTGPPNLLYDDDKTFLNYHHPDTWLVFP